MMGRKHHKLTQTERDDILRLKAEGRTGGAISDLLHIPRSTIQDVIHKSLEFKRRTVPSIEQVVEVLNYLLNNFEDLRRREKELTTALAHVQEKEFWRVYEDLKRGR